MAKASNTSRSPLRPVILYGTLALSVSLCALAWAAAEDRYWADVTDHSAADVAEARKDAAMLRGSKAAGRQRKAVLPGEIHMTELLETAATSVGIGMNQIQRIDHLPEVRLRKSEYLEAATRVVLDEVSTQQVVRFLHAIGTPRVRLKSLRFSARSRKATAWQVELVFAVLIYQPQERVRG